MTSTLKEICMLILFDQDSVLADFDYEFERRWNMFNVCPAIPTANRTNFYYKVDYPKEYGYIVDLIMEQEGLYRNLPPIHGAINAAKTLLDEGHDVRICTSPSNYTFAPNEKGLWILEHMGREFEKRIIMTNDKTMVKADVLIDDKPEITGAFIPEWRRIIVDQPYNRHIDGPRIVDWNDENVWKSIILGNEYVAEPASS